MPHLFHDTVILTDQRHAWDLLYGANDWMSFQGGLNDVITAAGSGMQQVDLFDAKHMTIDDLNPGDFILGIMGTTGSSAVLNGVAHSAEWFLCLDDSSARQGTPATFSAMKGGTMVATSGDHIFVAGESEATVQAHTLG